MNSFIRKSARKLSFIFACALFVVTALGNLGSIPVRAESRQFTYVLTEGRMRYFFDDLGDELFAFYNAYIKYLDHSDSVYEGEFEKTTYYLTNNQSQALVVKSKGSGHNYVATVEATDNSNGEFKVVLNKKNLEEFYRKHIPSKTDEEYEKLALDSMKDIQRKVEYKFDVDGSAEYVFLFKFGKPEFVKRTITLDFRDGNKYEGVGSGNICVGYDLVLDDITEYWGSYEEIEDEENNTYYTRAILSTNPKQVIDITYGSSYNVNLIAEDGCSGAFSIVLNEDILKEAMEKKYPESLDIDYDSKNHIRQYERYLKDFEDGDGLSEYTFIFKFGTTQEEKPEEKPIENPNTDNPSGQTPTQEVTPAQESASKVEEAAPKYVPGTKFEAKGLKYEIIDTDGNVKFKGAKSKKVKTITVPSTVKYDGASLPVTTIGAGAIKGLSKLTKVTLGANVTTLQKNSIYGCKKLSTLQINSTKLTSVAKKAVGSNAKGFKIKVKKSSQKNYKALFKKAGMGKITIK